MSCQTVEVDLSLGSWDPMTPEAVAELFGNGRVPWWIAGGYAIELYLGSSVRSHDDIDVLLLRRDQATVHEVLAGWDVCAADPPGSLRPWEAGEWLPPEVHDIWCRERPDGRWRLQVMLDHADGAWWTSRRDVRVSREIASLGWRTAGGIPVLAPEVQLFYKAKNRRTKDETDFVAVLPALTLPARQWLDDALALVHPGHPWRSALGG